MDNPRCSVQQPATRIAGTLGQPTSGKQGPAAEQTQHRSARERHSPAFLMLTAASSTTAVPLLPHWRGTGERHVSCEENIQQSCPPKQIRPFSHLPIQTVPPLCNESGSMQHSGSRLPSLWRRAKTAQGRAEAQQFSSPRAARRLPRSLLHLQQPYSPHLPLRVRSRWRMSLQSA